MNLLRELFKYRELLKNNVKKEVRGRYKKSFMGILWTFLNPLLQLAVYATVFPLILKIKQEAYVIFVCTGLIPWTFFTASVAQSTFSVVSNGNIVKKVYFPREILPLSIVLSAFVNFLISNIIIVLFCYIYGLNLTWHIVFLPIVMLVQFVLQLAIAIILSAITVYVRDVEHFVQILLMLMFYLTPIVYSYKDIPKEYQFIYKLNPMTHIINGYRAIYYEHTIIDFAWIFKVFAFAILLLAFSLFVFRKLQKGFAEEL